MSKLSEYRENVEKKDFLSISKEDQERMTEITKNVHENHDLMEINVCNIMRTIKQLNPNLNFHDLETAYAMIASCALSVLDFLVENGSLKVEDLKKGAKK